MMRYMINVSFNVPLPCVLALFIGDFPRLLVKERHPACSNKLIGAPISPIMLQFEIYHRKLIKVKMNCTQDMITSLALCILNFNHSCLLDHHLKHYRIYRGTDTFIGTNWMLLLNFLSNNKLQLI